MDTITTRTRKFNLNKSRNADRLFRIKLKYSQNVGKTSVRYGKRSKKLVFRPANKVPFKTTNISVYRNQLRRLKNNDMSEYETFNDNPDNAVAEYIPDDYNYGVGKFRRYIGSILGFLGRPEKFRKQRIVLGEIGGGEIIGF